MAIDPGSVASSNLCAIHPERCDPYGPTASCHSSRSGCPGIGPEVEGGGPDLLELVAGAAIGGAVGGLLGPVGAAVGGSVGANIANQIAAAVAAGDVSQVFNLLGGLGSVPSLVGSQIIPGFVAQIPAPFRDPGGLGGGVLTAGPYLGQAGQLAGELLKKKRLRLETLLTGPSTLSKLLTGGNLLALS